MLELRTVTDELVRAVSRLRFVAPVAHVYNPLQYARCAYDEYLNRYAKRRAPTLLIGMNPGPWGMVQTGVPFGAVPLVRDWLRIERPFQPPRRQHPARPILGLNCRRTEVSGERLWGWARRRYGSPAKFFDQFFVANYCPLAFLEMSGANRTPDKLPAAERSALLQICDRALRDTIDVLRPQRVIGIGRFAAGRARLALEHAGPQVGEILHPSPASPRANRNWEATIEQQLIDLGVTLPCSGSRRDSRPG